MSKKEFDALIKKQLDLPDNLFGYDLEGRTYSNYFTTDEFQKYKEMLKEIKLDGKNKTAYEAYGAGKGAELDEKRHKGGKKTPPNMASVASSSRFTVEAVLKAPRENIREIFGLSSNYNRDVERGFAFQKGGIAPQLDAYLWDESKEIFIEAKCHEIFASHSMKMKKSYASHFEEYVPHFKTPNFDHDDEFTLDLSLLNLDSNEKLKFDAKQAIAHILGVKKKRRLNSKVVFLFFKPANDPIFEVIKKQTRCFIGSDFIKSIINKEFEVEFAFQESLKMEPLSKQNYVPFLRS